MATKTVITTVSEYFGYRRKLKGDGVINQWILRFMLKLINAPAKFITQH